MTSSAGGRSAPSRAASLGWMATPATTAGQRSAAATAHREPATSQPICTTRVTPTWAARASASAGSRPDIACVESRWQCESTTGPGQRLRQFGQIHSPTLSDRLVFFPERVRHAVGTARHGDWRKKISVSS